MVPCSLCGIKLPGRLEQAHQSLLQAQQDLAMLVCAPANMGIPTSGHIQAGSSQAMMWSQAQAMQQQQQHQQQAQSAHQQHKQVPCHIVSARISGPLLVSLVVD